MSRMSLRRRRSQEPGASVAGLGPALVATGFIHLDRPANDNARPREPQYSWSRYGWEDVKPEQLTLLARAGILRVDADGYALTHLGRILVER